MVLLDAALAFALTLAALATVVTIIMEILLRFIGLRKKDQVEVIKRLYDEVLSEDTGLTARDVEKRWEVVRRVLENPFAKKPMKRSESEQAYWGTAGSGIYTDVSLEHVLRRFIEIDEIKKTYEHAHQQLRAKLTELSQKYEEYCSAVGAQFADNARWWSLVFGVLLALVMNVDGVRLFQSYMENPERAALIIAQMDPILEQVEEAQAKLDAAVTAGVDKRTVAELEAAAGRLQEQLTAVQEPDLPIGQLFYPHCWLFGGMELRRESLDPYCKAGDQDPARLAGTVGQDKEEETFFHRLEAFFTWLCEHWADTAFLTWLVKVLVTGLLIGLGAPFWYDVAKRLGQVRLAFGGKGSAVQRYSGSDATVRNGESKGELIDRIMSDRAAMRAAEAERAAQAGASAPQAEG